MTILSGGVRHGRVGYRGQGRRGNAFGPWFGWLPHLGGRGLHGAFTAFYGDPAYRAHLSVERPIRGKRDPGKKEPKKKMKKV